MQPHPDYLVTKATALFEGGFIAPFAQGCDLRALFDRPENIIRSLSGRPNPESSLSV